MIRNYLKIAWRNLRKNKLFSFINIISLAIGLSASFVIGLMVYYDFTFDKFHPDGDRIYRVVTKLKIPKRTVYFSGIPVPLDPAMEENMPGVENASYFITYSPEEVSVVQQNTTFKRPEFTVFVDEDYFDLFDYTWLAGNKEKALLGPNKVVLTEANAKKYFPNVDPQEILGKVLVYNDSINTEITGIVANFGQRTDLVFQEFISLPTALNTYQAKLVNGKNWNFMNSASQLFIKLNKNTKSRYIQEQLDKLSKIHETEEDIELGRSSSYQLQPLENLHFSTRYGIFGYGNAPADKSVLLALAGIALFLLLLGCINFINLNTAQATQRAKEIGIRKTLGSSKKQLVSQFLGETFLLVFSAAILSLMLSVWLLHIFSDFIPDGLNLGLLANPVIIVLIIVLLLVVTFLSGFYPAVVLSRFKPAAVIKNQVVSSNHKSSFRKSLTVFQFVIAQVFIISTLLVGKQIRFMMTDDMGIRTESVTYVRTPWRDNSMDKRLRFMEKMQKLPQVKEVSIGGAPPASNFVHSTIVSYFDGKNKIQTKLQLLYGDTNYLNLYDIKLLAGRNLRSNDAKEFIINETFLKQLGFENPREAIGKTLEYNNESYPIVGVMEDFNQRSLKDGIEPMAYMGDWSEGGYSQFNRIHLLLKTGKTENLPVVISTAEEAWKDIYPGKDFTMKFMDETVQQFYVREQKTSKLLNWATGLAVLISCLGLLGLVIHTTERRTKEIGIRKVLGASIKQLNVLLCREFLLLVALAFLIAAPIAWWGLHNWLQNFAYKTDLNWWVFLLSGVLMLLLALFIMGARIWSTARKNPVKSLRSE